MINDPRSARAMRVCSRLTKLLALAACFSLPALAQITATWSGGSGAWSPCPNESGTALWDTCSLGTPEFPNGPSDNAIILGGPVAGTGALVANLTVGTGASLILNPGYLEVDGTSISNNGAIQIGPGNGLQIEGSGTVTLSGAGTISMIDPNADFTGGNGTPTLINQQTIQGQGNLLGLSITNQGTINATGGELNIQPNSLGMNNPGLIEVQSGAKLDLISGPFNNTGGTIESLNGSSILLQANISGGTITTTGSGYFTLAPPGAGAGLTGLTNGGTFNVVSGANLNWQGTITNTGIFNLDGSITTNGSVTLQGGGTVLMNGGEFEGFSTNPLINTQLIHGGGQFYEVPLTNQGTIQADNTSTMLAIAGGSTTNTATMQATGGGTLQLDTVVNNSGGVIEAQTGSKVILTSDFNGSVNGGTLTTSGTGVIESENGVLDGTVNVPTNAGKMTVDNFDLYFQGTINNTGTIALSGHSCIVMNQPSTLTGSGKVTMTSTTCFYGSGIPFTNSSTIEGSGTIGDSNPMPITNNGTILANQKSPLLIVPDSTGFTNNGKLTVNKGCTLSVEGLFNNLPPTGVLTGGIYLVTGTLNFPNPVVSNDASITLTGAPAEIFSSNAGTNGLAALAGNATAGVLSLQKGQALTTGTDFDNAGKTTVGATSSLTIGGSYTQTAGTTTVDGTLTSAGGLSVEKGSLLGQGTVAAPVTSSATVTVGDATTKAGKLTVTGSYTQNATGILNVAIGGATAGTQYSQLAVSSGVSLNGTVSIKRIGGFVPAIGDTFTVVTGSTVSGQFSTVKGTSINASEHFEVVYTGTSVTLTVVSGA